MELPTALRNTKPGDFLLLRWNDDMTIEVVKGTRGNLRGYEVASARDPENWERATTGFELVEYPYDALATLIDRAHPGHAQCCAWHMAACLDQAVQLVPDLYQITKDW